MTRCMLCHSPAVDEHGLCSRTSITHDALRHPDQYPPENNPELWEFIDNALATGTSVFPTIAPCPTCGKPALTGGMYQAPSDPQ